MKMEKGRREDGKGSSGRWGKVIWKMEKGIIKQILKVHQAVVKGSSKRW